MFGYIANVVIGLLSSMYGIVKGATTLTFGSPTSQILGGDGTAAAPFYSWTNSTGSGWYNAGSNIFRYQVNGTTEVDVRPGQAALGGATNSILCVGTSYDAGFARAAANVIKMSNASSTPGWLQNTAGEKRRTATQTVTNSASLTADDTLSFTLIAGRRYRFWLWYIFTTVNTSGVQIDLNGGNATMTAINGIIRVVNPTTGAVGNGTQITALTTVAGLTATGTLYTAEAWGSLECNAAGTFAPRFAQNAETVAAESVIAQIGSYMTLADVP